MYSITRPSLVFVTGVLLVAAAFAGDASAAEIPLRELQQICTVRDPNDAERSMAEAMRMSARTPNTILTPSGVASRVRIVQCIKPPRESGGLITGFATGA